MRFLAISLLAMVLGLFHFDAAIAATCISRFSNIPIAEGLSPTDAKWTITASTHANGSCNMGLLELQFDLRLPDSEYGWLHASATPIPAHGHLSEDSPITAREAPTFVDPQEGYLSGFIGSDAVKAVAEFTDGTFMRINPTLPSSDLRKKFVWLRGLRYITVFYPSDHVIRHITIFSADGMRLERSRNEAGAFF